MALNVKNDQSYVRKILGGKFLAHEALHLPHYRKHPKKQSAAPSLTARRISTKEVGREQMVPHPIVLVSSIHLQESLCYALVDHKIVEAEHLDILGELWDIHNYHVQPWSTSLNSIGQPINRFGQTTINLCFFL